MAAPRPLRRRCDGCGQLVDVTHAAFGHKGSRRVRHQLCDHCYSTWTNGLMRVPDEPVW